MPFQTSCDSCTKTFKTGAALKKHLIKVHASLEQQVVFKAIGGNEFKKPNAAEILDSKQKDEYKRWLTVLVERINNSLIPCHPGKWVTIDCYQVPSEYFSHILHRLLNPDLHSVREVGHRRPPIFRKLGVKLSYKIYDESLLLKFLEEQSEMPFKSSALYCNEDEIPDVADMDVDEALNFAKERSHKKVSSPTMNASVEIGLGEGRRTREVEIIWWPEIYLSDSSYGKFSLRFFVQKVRI